MFVWDTTKDRNAITLCATLSGKEDRSLNTLDMSFSGKRLVYGRRWGVGDGIVRVWDRDNVGEICVPSEMKRGDVTCFAMSKDGRRVVSGSLDGTMRIWNVDSAESTVQEVHGHTSEVSAVVFSADEEMIISAAFEDKVLVWDAQSGAKTGEYAAHGEWIRRIALSADGIEAVLVVDNCSSLVLKVEKMKRDRIRAFQRTGLVRCFAYSGNGKTIVTGCEDGCVRLWDAKSGAIVGQQLVDNTRAIDCVAVSGCGNLIVSASRDKTIRV